MKDDARIGIQSSALSLHSRLPFTLQAFASCTLLSTLTSGVSMNVSPVFYATAFVAVGLPLHRLVRGAAGLSVDEAGKRFRESVWVGLGVVLAFWVEILAWGMAHVVFA
jgi:4-hydroxybenzoate polyprenyltransferase